METATKNTAAQTKAMKAHFNTTAQALGCRARIEGTAKKIEFMQYLGYDSKDGREWIQKIDSNTFFKLIAKYPQLNELFM